MSKPAPGALFALGVRSDAYDLPHPRVELPIILILRRVVSRAIALLEQRGFQLATAQEDEVTNALFAVVENDLRRNGSIPGFNANTFDPVVRHAKVVNYNFEKTKKEPDLCFRLRCDGEPRRVIGDQDAIFVECKPVDKKHYAGSHYCDDGLFRFVDGDYAWAMQDAIMLAYVRDGRSPDQHLMPAMAERVHRLKIVDPLRSVARAPAERGADVLYRSRHERGFLWPDDKGPASNIWIYHLWHRCDG